jgi:hypothetical protein
VCRKQNKPFGETAHQSIVEKTSKDLSMYLKDDVQVEGQLIDVIFTVAYGGTIK